MTKSVRDDNLLTYAEAIKAYCAGRKCKECIFMDSEVWFCAITTNTAPENWDISILYEQNER